MLYCTCNHISKTVHYMVEQIHHTGPDPGSKVVHQRHAHFHPPAHCHNHVQSARLSPPSSANLTVSSLSLTSFMYNKLSCLPIVWVLDDFVLLTALHPYSLLAFLSAAVVRFCTQIFMLKVFLLNVLHVNQGSEANKKKQQCER